MIPFSFRYGDRRIRSDELSFRIMTAEEDGVKKETATALLGSLTVTRETLYYPEGPAKALTYFENTSDTDTEQIADVLDLDSELAWDAPSLPDGYRGYGNAAYLRLKKYFGSNNNDKEFATDINVLRNGQCERFGCHDGRSSQGYAPFFAVVNDKKTVLCAVGWTGEWRAQAEKHEKALHLSAGIPDLNFKLFPGEKVRTASVMLYETSEGEAQAHNTFKRTLKNRLVPEAVRRQGLPFFLSFWGGSSTDFMLRQLETIRKSDAGVTGFWVDAAWYGERGSQTRSEFGDGWCRQTGNWTVNEEIHPDGLEAVFKKAKECGLRTMLWVEPERCYCKSELAKRHPDYCLKETDHSEYYLLNYSDPAVVDYVYDLLSGIIRRLGLDLYRQDFNMDPLGFWSVNDEPDRKGIHQIKHIMGMYSLWDRLRETFPDLVIDNCASGGRRLDIETLSRSVPLWRSDYQCEFDCAPFSAQNNMMGISQWIPYSATGTGFGVTDTYRVRSAYSAGLCSNFFGYESFAPETIPDELKALAAEWKRICRFFSCDYYPVFGLPVTEYAWGGWQFDDPESGDGILMAFRRENCPTDRATVQLGGLREDATYEFTDADTNERFTIKGSDLKKNGFTICLPQKRSSKLIEYKIV